MRISNNGGVYNETGVFTTGADYADMFKWETANPIPKVGDTVVLTRSGKVTSAIYNNTQLESSVIIGVVSEKPAITGGYNLENAIPIGLLGRLKVNKKSPVNPNWFNIREIDSEFDEWVVK